jgi:hypothetical protein
MHVCGGAATWPRLWLAYGHGHSGLTLGPVTGRLIAEMMTGGTTSCDPAPYGPNVSCEASAAAVTSIALNRLWPRTTETNGALQKPDRPDDPRQHARQRRAVAGRVVLVVPPPYDPERGIVARSRAGVGVRAAHVYLMRHRRRRRGTVVGIIGETGAGKETKPG